jgi:hypothetical protein
MLYSDKLVKQKFSRHRLVCLLSLLAACMGSLADVSQSVRSTLRNAGTARNATRRNAGAAARNATRCLGLSRGSRGGQRRHVRRRKLPGNDEESIIGWRVHNAHVPLLEPRDKFAKCRAYDAPKVCVRAKLVQSHIGGGTGRYILGPSLHST